MKKFLTSALAAIIVISTAAFSQEWHHASAPMGQHEGDITLENGAKIIYGCAASSTIIFSIPIQHAGMASIFVDGADIARLQTEPSSDGKSTLALIDAEFAYSRAQNVAFNQVLLALANGNEVAMRTDAGEVLQSWPLKGSAGIKSCLFHIST